MTLICETWCENNDYDSEISYLQQLTKNFKVYVVDQLIIEGLNQVSNIYQGLN